MKDKEILRERRKNDRQARRQVRSRGWNRAGLNPQVNLSHEGDVRSAEQQAVATILDVVPSRQLPFFVVGIGMLAFIAFIIVLSLF